MGIAYDKSRATTDEDTMALNTLHCQRPYTLGQGMTLLYLDDPRKIRPNTITVIVAKRSALNGSRSLGWTAASQWDAGNPPSLYSVSVENFTKPAEEQTWQMQISCDYWSS